MVFERTFMEPNAFFPGPCLRGPLCYCPKEEGCTTAVGQSTAQHSIAQHSTSFAHIHNRIRSLADISTYHSHLILAVFLVLTFLIPAFCTMASIRTSGGKAAWRKGRDEAVSALGRHTRSPTQFVAVYGLACERLTMIS